MQDYMFLGQACRLDLMQFHASCRASAHANIQDDAEVLREPRAVDIKLRHKETTMHPRYLLAHARMLALCFCSGRPLMRLEF